MFGKRTELQQEAYETIPKEERKKRLSYRYSVENNLLVKNFLQYQNRVVDFETQGRFLRNLDTIYHKGQYVPLAYLGKEHYLLLRHRNTHNCHRGLGFLTELLRKSGYSVKINGIEDMSCPEVMHLHVWK